LSPARTRPRPNCRSRYASYLPTSSPSRRGAAWGRCSSALPHRVSRGRVGAMCPLEVLSSSGQTPAGSSAATLAAFPSPLIPHPALLIPHSPAQAAPGATGFEAFSANSALSRPGGL
jgi:hypothetical protein